MTREEESMQWALRLKRLSTESELPQVPKALRTECSESGGGFRQGKVETRLFVAQRCAAVFRFVLTALKF